jgi:hypothetical protein
MMIHMTQAAGAGQDPNPIVMAIATEALRNSLMAWMDVAGPKFDEAMQHEAEFEAKYGQRVDDLIAFIFSAPSDSEAAMAAEEDAIRRAQGIL